MDEFYEYWELIPEFEKYEKVGKVSRSKVFSALLELKYQFDLQIVGHR